MIVLLAFTLNIKNFLFLIGAVAFGILVIASLLESPRGDWKVVVSYAAWCLGFIAWFVWGGGG